MLNVQFETVEFVNMLFFGQPGQVICHILIQ